MAKARGKRDKARQRELQSDIRTLRREVRKREVGRAGQWGDTCLHKLW